MNANSKWQAVDEDEDELNLNVYEFNKFEAQFQSIDCTKHEFKIKGTRTPQLETEIYGSTM